ncbi:hypothetical protein RclHR1_03720014 [Rhizophagus clarus]|uniref:GATA-type zinc finger transcription factor n=1 Tax=Rhizophagus clarus TaxID=94130 RepID=A0A2Z6RG92_9GLOM|nr:hypothetical protein RclHR1_03720014 [Rhizophagus clarus]GES95970.1 GATA-type zinc finger transcription factor [Rhizophagus clarus]
MDVMAMCSSSPVSNQSVSRKIPEAVSTVLNLPSPPLIGTVNEKTNRSLPHLTSILRSPVSPLHEFNPTPRHDISSATVVNHTTSQMNYLQSPEPIARRSNLTSPSLSSSYSPILQSPNDTTSSMWSPPLSANSYYHQSPPPLPPPQYPYIPRSQQPSTGLINNHHRPSATTSMPYTTSILYTPGSDDYGDDNDSPYIQQTAEQSFVKMGKVVDYCNQIVHFALQYRDMKTNYNPWNGAAIPQVTESHLANIINKAYDVLNIVSSLKSEITARPSSIELSQDEIDLIRKHRTLNTHTRTKYRKRNRAAPPRRCHSCNISETPEWRRGPDGARTLCNACGLHFAKITRKRTLSSAMQQTDQQQQTSSNSSNINLTSSVPENQSIIEIIDD